MNKHQEALEEFKRLWIQSDEPIQTISLDENEAFKKLVGKTTRRNEKKMSEKVNHPEHYNQGKYECIEVMEDIYGAEALKNFCLLNAFKYVWRANKKNGKEDIEKAIWYLNKYLESEKE